MTWICRLVSSGSETRPPVVDLAAMEANVTELWQIVESMQLELDSMSMDMDALWLMVGAILVVCESVLDGHNHHAFSLLC